jgi:hypothetical protein
MWVEAVVSLRNPVLRKSAIILGLSSLFFIASCSNNNVSGNPVVICPGNSGNFSNASLLPGSQWTYELSGWYINNSTGNYTPYVTAGSFVADGKGKISSGFDEFLGGPFHGTYSINANGTGTITVNVNAGGTLTPLSWAITLSNNNPASMYVIEQDSSANSAGAAYQQTSSALSAAPNGTFVFRSHVLAGATSFSGSSARIGVMSVSNGTISTAGFSEDYLLANGIPSQPTLTSGAFAAPDTIGRGTLTFTDSSGTYNFDYFVIDANNYIWFETDAVNGGLGIGRMETQQNPGAYTNASLTAGAGYVFNSHGDTVASGAFGVNSVGQFAVDGAGSVPSGSYDSVRDGTPVLGAQISSSTYTVQPNGRVLLVLQGSAAPVQQTAYLVSGSRGFFLVNNDTSRVEDGTLEQQTSASFSAGNFTGQAGFVMGGSIAGSSSVFGSTGGPVDRTGTIFADGNGHIDWAEIANSAGQLNAPGCLTGTYTVASNGRVLATVNTLSTNLIFYMVAPTKWYVIQGDSGTQIYGGAAIQTSPVLDPPGAF